MSRIFFSLLALLGILSMAWLWLGRQAPPASPRPALSVAEAMSGSDTTGFSRALAVRDFHFPEDLGPHPDFRTEWWYYTGNLFAEDGRRFGYQFTIFRSAMAPPDSLAARTSNWATGQLYLAHFALSDPASNRFYSYERLSRGAMGLAGSQAFPFRVWLEDWETGAPDHRNGPGIPRLHLRADAREVGIDLSLRSLKPPVLQGDRGLSPKSERPGNASYYFSLTRLESEGTVTIGKERFAVSGLSWKDREWSTSALDSNQVGWDWFSLQLSDDRDIMVFQLRDREGRQDFAKGSLVAANGTTRLLTREDLLLKPLAFWTSPSGNRYPIEWALSIPGEKLNLTLKAVMPDQELRVSIRYWEGAVDVQGTAAGQPVEGRGYLEMTGYADDGNPGSTSKPN